MLSLMRAADQVVKRPTAYPEAGIIVKFPEASLKIVWLKTQVAVQFDEKVPFLSVNSRISLVEG
jgi:hypothetical protein